MRQRIPGLVRRLRADMEGLIASHSPLAAPVTAPAPPRIDPPTCRHGAACPFLALGRCRFRHDDGEAPLPRAAAGPDSPQVLEMRTLEVDKDVQKELEEDCGQDYAAINWSEEVRISLGSRLHALWNRSAGDCLLDSVLQATWGVFDRDNNLRTAMADSLHEAGQV